MSDEPQGRAKALGVTLEPDLFKALAYYGRRYGMAPREFIAHLVSQFVTAMQSAEPAAKGSNRGR